MSHDSSIYGQNILLSNHSYAALKVGHSGHAELHDCEILNGGGWSVECRYDAGTECHLDLTNNYWGTDSQEQIEEWIYDGSDNPEYCCIVDFIPFDGAMALESRSWSAVKQLFRGQEQE